MDEAKALQAISQVESYTGCDCCGGGRTTFFGTFSEWKDVYDLIRQEKVHLVKRKPSYILTFICSRRISLSLKCPFRIFVVFMPEEMYRVYTFRMSFSKKL